MQKFADNFGSGFRRRPATFLRLALWSCAALLLLAATARAQQAPLNDNFTNATVISGLTGTATGNNIGATLQPGEANAILTSDNGLVSVGESVWYEWTAPSSGNVTFDTFGSVDANYNTMDTVLAAYTGQTLATLSLAGANDNANASTVNSSLTFFATAGLTYYVAIYVNTGNAGQAGNYVLNWKEQGAPIGGEFRMTSASYEFSQNENNGPLDPRGHMQAIPARVTVTRVGGASGMVDVGYYITNTWYTNFLVTNIFATSVMVSTVDSNSAPLGLPTNYVTTISDATETYENYSKELGFYYSTRLSSALTVATNINGVLLPPFYTNGLAYVPGPFDNTQVATAKSVVVNGTQSETIISGVPLIPAVSTSEVTNTDLSVTTTVTTYFWTNIYITNIISSYLGNAFPAGGTVTFDDFQMNEDISLPAPTVQNPYLENPVAIVVLYTNYLDALEDQAIPAPTIQANRAYGLVTFLNNEAVPGDYGIDSATNNVVNFERSTLRCDKTVNGSDVAYVGVTLNRGNNANAVTVYYEIDTTLANDDFNTFILQAGSDYAQPDDATKFITGSDFTSVTGTITFPQYDSRTKFIQIPITQDNVVKFNRDIRVQLYYPPGVTYSTMNCYYGTIVNNNMTILYTTPPAGANDVNYNADNNPGTSPPYNPNPGANGVVYAAVVQPADGKAVIGGDFTGYNSESGSAQNYIARLTTSGQLDTTFNTGYGFDNDVEALAVDSNANIIAVGEFHSYNNALSKGIARITPSGALDPTFNTGLGANSTVWATAIQPNGQILIAGDFTTFNSTNRNYIARLNQDGSVDSSFDPVVGPNADIYSIAVQTNGQIVIGGAFTQVDGTNLNYIARLNADGSLDTTFNPGYGFGANNVVNSVVVQPDGRILLGGLFTQVGNLGGEGLARLNSDGTVDTTFLTGTGTSDEVNTVVLNPDGTILIGGWFTSYNQTRRIGFARILPDGELDTSFLDTAYNQFAGVINDYYDPNVNPPNPIHALAVQPDGNILVGGSFYQIGGGGTRDDIHPRQNFARVIGGSTPGPGNVELSLSSYTADSSSPKYYVQVDRTNGSLGAVSATVSAVPTGSGAGYASYGVDYTYALTSPVWGVSWSADTWMLADGLYGTNNNEFSLSGTIYLGLSSVYVNIISNNNNNASLKLAMTQPKGMDTFFLGGTSAAGVGGFGSVDTAEGENIPLAVALGNTTAPLTIVHDNPHDGVFNFSSANYYVSEGNGNATITVTRTSGTDNAVTVQYSTSDGTALNGTDYRSASGKLPFSSGQASNSFTVPLINGTVARPDRYFNVHLTIAGGGAALGSLTNAQVEIVNDNFSSGQIQFAYGNYGTNAAGQTISYGTNENSGPLQVTVSRLGGVLGLVSVKVATSDGSAVNGKNYFGVTNTLTWTNGDASTRTIYIPVLDDGVVTSNLTANITLSNPMVNNTNAPLVLALSSLTNATLVITNTDSVGKVQFTSSSYTVNENAGYAIIPVYRTGGSIGTLSVNYSTTNGTATAGANYVATNGTLVFAPGQVSTNFIVWINNQGTPWVAPLNFGLVLSSANTNILGSPTVAQMNINGSAAFNNPPGQPSTAYSSTAGFNAPVFSLALQPNGQLLAGGDFTTADGVPRNRIARLNADGTLDASFSSYLPSFGANSTVRSIVVQDNGLILMSGLFTNYNSSTINYIGRLNVDGTVDATFKIGAGADNPVYAMASTYVNGARTTVLGGAFTMINGTPLNSIARLLDNGTVDTTFNAGLGANATVYALAVQPDGKIVIGGDFTAVNGTNYNHIARLNQNGSVDTTFNPGLGPNDSVRAIALQLDGSILIGGLFTNVNNVALNHIARLLANGAVDPSFNIGAGANDNVSAIAVQPDTRIIVAGDFTRCSGVNRSRITRLNPNGTVDPTINFGTGADNFVAATVIESDGNIDIGGGFQNYNGASHPYLAQIYGGSLAGSGAIQFASSSYQVDEKGTNVLISIIRTGGTSGNNSDGTGDILIGFTTTNESAVAGVNYTAVTTNVDFPAGEVLETVSIPVFDDGLVTTNLTVGLTLTNPTSPAVIGNVPSATLHIINDDSSVSFSTTGYTVGKSTPGGEAVVVVDRQGSQTATNTVEFSTGNGTAAPITDYTPVDEILTFDPGVSNLTVNVAINNNGLAEGNRTIPLQLSNPVGAYQVAPSNAVLTIIDSVQLPGEFVFSATNYPVTEGGGSGVSPVLVTVVRTNGSSGTVSVNYSTMDGTAVYGQKYIPTNGSLTFYDGVSSQSFYVQAINTTTAEGPEYLYVELSNPTDGASVIQSNATVTILNTNIGIAFVSATNSFTEPFGLNPGTVTLNVVRYNNTNGTTTVNYYTSNDTNVATVNMAVAGTNYVATNGTVTFNPGDSIKPITITTLYDPAVSPDLYFNVALSLTNGSKAQLTSPSVTTVIDHDVNAGISFFESADSVYKNAGTETVLVYCSNTNEEPISVNYSTGGGTALAGVDYTASSGLLTFTNGQTINTIFIPILPNNLVQSNKTFNVTLSNPTGTGVVYPVGTNTITILNTNTPYGLSFSTPVVLSGDWGTATVDNTLGAPESGDPTLAGLAPSAPVWFTWTAPANGEVTLDTIGSYGTNGMILDTVLGVFTGKSLNTLNQISANDDLYPNYPETQINTSVQNIWDTNAIAGLTGISVFLGSSYSGEEYDFSEPFKGPSGLRFNAVAGTTYYIEADTKSTATYQFVPYPPYIEFVLSGRGPIALNWAYHSSGVFRFATENVDQTGIISTNLNPTLLYQCSETEGGGDSTLAEQSLTNGGVFLNIRRTSLDHEHGIIGPVKVGEVDTTLHTTYDYDVDGLLVTVTRVAGSSGRVSVDYTTEDGDPNVIGNGDIPAVSNVDYAPVSGTLIFDDYEMSKTIVIPILDDDGLARPNRDFVVALSNPQRDSRESGEVSPPRVDHSFGQVVCRILDCDIDPKGPSQQSVVTTNTIVGTTNQIIFTNTIYSATATNAIFNFSKANYRVPRDVTNYWKGTQITLYVNRMGTNTSSVTLHYRFDGDFLDDVGIDDENNEFTLQPGSDYAVPYAANPPLQGAIYGPSLFDYEGNGGESGTLTFPGGKKNPFQTQPIYFTVYDNHIPEFNKDIHVTLYGTDSNGNPIQDGMVAETTVTILFDDTAPPAGSVDELYNPDFAVNMAVTNEIGSDVANPGTEPYSEIYSLAVIPTNQTTSVNQTMIAGAFTTYSDANNTYTVNGIARLNFDGTLDPSFNPGSGVDVFPDGEFIHAMALTTNNQVVVGGKFRSFNGTQRYSIARLNTDGSVDGTFNPGAGVTTVGGLPGTVWAMALQPDGRVVIGGDFIAYNGQPAQYIARVNPDGSLDNTFNAGTNFNAAVYALALQSNGAIVAGGAFKAVGGTGGQSYVARLNADGSLDTTFDTITGPNAPVRALAVQPDGNILAGGEFTLVAGQSDNYIVRFTTTGALDSSFNSGIGTDGTVYSINDNIVTNADGSTTSQIYVGGTFTSFNGTHRLGFARLYGNGSVDTTFLDTAYNQYAGLPRIYYSDTPGTVYASGVQSDGNVMIAGAFQAVGGGEADYNVRDTLEGERDLTPSFADTNLWVSESGMEVEPKTRDGERIRGNVARLIGGATPGPGNLGFAASSYAVNKTQLTESISLIRTNGNLGYASANFSVVPGDP